MQTIFETLPSGTIEKMFTEMQEIKNLLARKREPEELITRKEACELLNVTDVTIWNWAKQGRIKTYKIGNRVMLKRSEILEEISNNITKK
ncbi:helix-turn-helix domain-containing protein [Chryseobacterium sp. A321]